MTSSKGGEAGPDTSRGRKPNPMANEMAALRPENERLERVSGPPNGGPIKQCNFWGPGQVA